MFCESCSEEVPEDSIFCPECGARQNLSRASFGAPAESLSGGVATSSGTGVVTPQAINRSSSTPSQTSSISDDLLSQIASKAASEDNAIMNGTPLSQISSANTGPTIVPMTSEMGVSPSGSPTDELVERIIIAEKEIKEEQRSKWLQMNETASNVLSQVNSELPSHLRPSDEKASAASNFLKQTIGDEAKDEELPDTSLLRRMTEVAVRRVARKRGVAVESPQSKLVDDVAQVNITFIDDGRVLDTPMDLANAFKRQIDTELALKGFELTSNIVLFKSRDGSVDKVYGENIDEEDDDDDDDDDSFACEACGELVKASDDTCQSCGAVFEDEEEEEERGPPGRRGGPSGRGGPPGRGPGGPPRGGGPPGRGPGGPPRGGGPPGRGSGGPPKGGGPPGRGSGGPPKGGGPPGRGPRGPPRGGGPPSGPKRGPSR